MITAITGANGFIGSTIQKKLIASGEQIITLKRPWKLSNSIDTLIHCGAYLPESYNNSSEADKCLMDNSIATLRLLEEAQKIGVKTFIYLSSGQIYSARPTFGNIMATENSSTFPSTRAPYYLVSKLVGDIFVDHFRQSSTMRIITIRPSSVYGPGMQSKGFLHRITTKFKNDELIKLEDVGKYILDLVHVEDVAGVSIKTIFNTKANGIYNVGGGSSRSTDEIVKLLAKLMDKKYIAVRLPIQWESSHLPLDISRATRELGYKPISLMDGLKSYVESL